MRVSLTFMCLAMLLCAGDVQARSYRRAKDVRILISGAFEASFASTAADTVAGASYTTKYSPYYPIAGGIGVLIHDNWYIGARFDYWLAGRVFDPGTGSQSDALRYLAIGGELGIAQADNRLQLYILGGLGYPLQLQIDSTAGTFTTPTKQLTFHGRVVGALSFSRYHAFFVEVGYRFAHLGSFTSGGTDYLSGGAELDLSGPFAGLGIHFEF
ncbi:MAG: hypothetical protein H6617_10020 [Bdellovibrionaceae bacterium]|nr:hypothetical protein [Bdellovibrionales bacterium]MCB9255006.1 hypothetical protein [Pseudobdellovibrionaceae bacterium]